MTSSSSSFGFKKGFLLSSSKASKQKQPHKPKRIATTESLLHLEKNETLTAINSQSPGSSSSLSPFLAVTDKEESKADTSPRRMPRGPLIQVLQEVEQDSSNESVRPSAASTSLETDSRAPKLKAVMGTRSKDSETTERRKQAFDEWNRDLASALSRMRIGGGKRQASAQKVAMQFVQSSSSSSSRGREPLNWTWDFVWQQQEDQGSPAGLEKGRFLAVALTLHDVHGFLEQLERLEHDDEAHGRRWMLVCEIVQSVLEVKIPLPLDVLQGLIETALPRLVSLIPYCSPARTVLAQSAFDAAFKVIATILEDDAATSLHTTVPDAVPHLQVLLSQQEAWLCARTVTEGKRARNACRTAVVRDWKLTLAVSAACQDKEEWREAFKGTSDVPLAGLWQTVQGKVNLDSVVQVLLQPNKNDDMLHPMSRSVAACLSQTKPHDLESDPIRAKQFVDSLVDMLAESSRHAAVVALLLPSLTLLATDTFLLQSRGVVDDIGKVARALVFTLNATSDHVFSSANECLACAILVQIAEHQGRDWLEKEVLSELARETHRIDLLVALAIASPLKRKVATEIIVQSLVTMHNKSYVVEQLRGRMDVFGDDLDLIQGLVEILYQLAPQDEPMQTESVVQLLVSVLEHHDQDNAIIQLTAELRSHSKTGATDRICQKLGDHWRSILFSSVDPSRLGDVLGAIAKVMLSNTSCLATLSLFGCVAGDETGIELQIKNKLNSQRILLATEKVLMLVVPHLKQVEQVGSTGIFGRLAPLLLIRRLPGAYFRTAFRSSDDTPTSLFEILSHLAKLLALRLDVEPAAARTAHFTAEERRLAAEIAGRSLSIDSKLECSCYQLICIPAFSQFFKSLSSGGVVHVGQQLSSLRSTRAALFAACTLLGGADPTENGRDLIHVASFAVGALCLDADTMPNDGVCDGLLQVQTGCIEFFAVCVEKFLLGAFDKGPRRNISSLGSMATRISQQIAEAARSGKADAFRTPWCTFLPQADAKIPVPALTCLWNAMLLVSRRCDAVSLRRVAEWLVPPTVSWGQNLDDEHPLVIATALETLFVILTRSKSFHDAQPCSIYRWILHSLQAAEMTQAGHYASRTLRLSSLKLLLAMLALAPSSESDEEELPTGLDSQQAKDVIRCVSLIVDANDTEIGQLKGHTLARLSAMLVADRSR